MSEEIGLYAIIGVGGHLAAVAAAGLRGFLVLPPVREQSRRPSHHRGFITRAGRECPVADLRVFAGLASYAAHLQDLVELLNQRERDHRRWLAELMASAREDRPFRLATDPAQCAFGQWYEAYVPTDPLFGLLLREFAEPHRRIHAVAARVEALKLRGDIQAALDLVETTRASDLACLVELLAEARARLAAQPSELAMVLARPEGEAVVTCDTVEAVELLAAVPPESEPAAQPGLFGELVVGYARSARRASLLPILDCARLFA